MDQVAVKHVVALSEGVHVRHQASRRLGLTDCDHPFRDELPERLDVHRVPDCLCRLRIHVVRKTVARVQELAIAFRVHSFEMQPEAAVRTLDTDNLRRHPNPHVPLTKDLGMRRTPIRRRIDPAAHIQPFDEHRPAERVRIDRPVHQNACVVFGGASLLDLPLSIGIELANIRVRRSRPRNEILRLLVADIRKVDPERPRNERFARARDGPLHRRIVRQLNGRTSASATAHH